MIALESQLDAPAFFDLDAQVHLLLAVIHARIGVKVISDTCAGITELGVAPGESSLVDAQDVAAK